MNQNLIKFLISVDQSRRINFPAELYLDGLRMFGILGDTLDAHFYFTQGVAGRNDPMSPAEVGCALSHCAALEAFLSDTSLTHALILEDDIILRTNDFVLNVTKSLSLLSSDKPAMLHLGGIDDLPCSSRVIGKKITKVGGGVYKLHPLSVRWLYMACGYIVNRPMAHNILAVQRKSLSRADAWSLLCKKHTIFFANFLIHDQKRRSAIEPQRRRNRFRKRSFWRKFNNILVLSFLIMLTLTGRFQRVLGVR